VNISGIDVGKVSSLDIDDNNKIHIDFFVYKDFQKLLRTDSKGELNKLSIVGNAVIIIKAGSSNNPMLPDGAVIDVAEPVTTDDLIAGVTPVIQDLKSLIADLSGIINAIKPETVQGITQDLHAVIGNVRQLSEHVNQGKGTVGRILYDKNQAASINNSLLLIEKNLAGLSARINETKPILENVHKLTGQTDAIMQDVHKTLQQFDQQIGRFPLLLENTEVLLETSQQTLKGAQKIWPLSSVLKPPNKDMLIKSKPLDE
jgi:phospholipid/cholesterol/gamma-HCH transport system substrate-binding protein